MPTELITNRNLSKGLDVPIVYINDISNGLFINMLIAIIWLSITMGIYFAQKRQTGYGDFPLALAVGAFISVIATILLGLVDGLVNTYTYVIVLVLALFSVLFFLFSSKESY